MVKHLLKKSYTSIIAAGFWLYAASTESVNGGELLPYRGGAAGYVVTRENINGIQPVPFGPAFCRVTAQAVGNFTHVGRSNVQLSYDMSLVVEDGVFYLIGNGSYLLTAANGDTLSGPIHTVQNYFTGEFTVESSISKGTGRFQGATGTMDGFGLLFTETDTFKYVLEGEMITDDSQTKKAK